MQSLKFERSQLQLTVSGVALIAALALALALRSPAWPALALSVVGMAWLLLAEGPAVARLVARQRSLVLVLVLAALVVVWLISGVREVNNARAGWPVQIGRPAEPWYEGYIGESSSWPWQVGPVSVLWLALTLICAGGGFVLIADAVRVQLGLARPPRSAWHSISANPTRGGRVVARAIPGVALIVAVGFVMVGECERQIADGRFALLVWSAVAAIGGALLVASPIIVGLLVGHDFNRERRARERERRQFSAHLHDSVLQTLALIQRQSDDPAAVNRLARRQEHALRSWMAGDVNLSTATLAGAVRDTVEEIEDEEQVKVELTMIGDGELDRRGEELIAAMREALRNAARHAPGAAVNVFLDVSTTRTELFVRDSGPGFVFEDVVPERRGVRDAIIGRMQSVGGSATVDSTPGEGTEIALRLPTDGGNR